MSVRAAPRREHGTDGAMTLIPNFLATGLAAILVSLAIAAWCLFFLRRRYGPAGFLALFVLLTLVGGGIGHTVFFLASWAYATRIRSTLARWRRALRPGVRRALAPLWSPALLTSSGLFLLALELSVFGFTPAAGNADALLAGIGVILMASLLALNLAYVAAIARDLRDRSAVMAIVAGS